MMFSDDTYDFGGPADAGYRGDDMDQMDLDSPYGCARCTCGRQANRYDRDFDSHAFAGCRGCDPVMHDCKPHGFGIERFEDPALLEANERSRLEWRGGPYQRLPMSREERDAIWKRNSVQSLRRLRHSEIVWDRLVDSCETHSEAVEKYKRWAKRAAEVVYRDEKSAAAEI